MEHESAPRLRDQHAPPRSAPTSGWRARGSAPRRVPDDACPRATRTCRRRCASREPCARARRRRSRSRFDVPAAASRSAPGSSTCCTSSASARCPSPSAATRPTRRALVHTIRAVGTVTRAMDGARARASMLGVRGPYGTRLAHRRGARPGRAVRRRRPRARAAPPGHPPRPRAPRRLRARSPSSTARARPTELLFREELDALARPVRLPRRGHRRPRRPRLARARRRGDQARRRRAASSPDDAVLRLRPGGHDALRRRASSSGAACRAIAIWVSLERNMKCGVGLCGHCQFGPTFVCKDGPVFRFDRVAPALLREGAVTWPAPEARGLEVRLVRRLPAQPARLRGRAARGRRRGRHRLLPRGDARASSRGPTTCRSSRARSPRRTTPSASARCGAQSEAAGHDRRLRHRGRDPGAAQLPRPRRRCCASSTRGPSTSTRSPPRRRSPTHVPVDFELRGCPIDKRQLLEVIVGVPRTAAGPACRSHATCVECKMRGTVCVMVAHGTPCLGPVTHAGCGALCPRYARGCYGCFGPSDAPHTEPLGAAARRAGRRRRASVQRLFRRFNAARRPFREEARAP